MLYGVQGCYISHRYSTHKHVEGFPTGLCPSLIDVTLHRILMRYALFPRSRRVANAHLCRMRPLSDVAQPNT